MLLTYNDAKVFNAIKSGCSTFSDIEFRTDLDYYDVFRALVSLTDKQIVSNFGTMCKQHYIIVRQPRFYANNRKLIFI